MSDESLIELQIDNIAQGGDGVARHENMVVFVPGGLPGERILAAVRDVRSSFMRAELREVLEPSPDRVAPQVAAGDHLPWQHIAYPAQLELKTTIVREQLEKLASVYHPPLKPTLASPQPWGYRNTIRLHAENGLLGYYAAGSREVIELTEDPLALPSINRALAGLRNALDLPEPGTNIRRPPLPFNGVILRASASFGYALAALDPAPGVTLPELEWLADRWRHDTPALAGVTLAGGRVLSGAGELHDELGGVTFVLGAESFFQVNAAQAARMIDLVAAELAIQPGERLLDAYSGVGTFALPLADGAIEVVAIEAHPGAVEDGERSAELNGIRQARFITGVAERVLPKLEDSFDAVILDPPRRGCHPEALAALVRMAPPRIAYVSCHPGILARDIGPLLGADYRLELVQPVDLFPQTPHIETVVILRR
ncbi:MAG: 23S rRNA (uracil(1939)-C(5))-methyltransferase RlmD [Oscillochloris sp.]|nr:23S rRNA (uracil(1939)-C(5))-methyltransferase RlmD [Oscillochloris sp.]